MWQDPPTTVFLLSIRTGAVGITLTAASHVYMVCSKISSLKFPVIQNLTVVYLYLA